MSEETIEKTQEQLAAEKYFDYTIDRLVRVTNSKTAKPEHMSKAHQRVDKAQDRLNEAYNPKPLDNPSPA